MRTACGCCATPTSTSSARTTSRSRSRADAGTSRSRCAATVADAAPMHIVAIGGRDRRRASARRRRASTSGRPSAARQRWRYESCFADYGTRSMAHRSSAIRTCRSRRRPARSARLGAQQPLPFTPAESVRPGMVMFTEDGGYDVVSPSSASPLDGPVYDINIEDTHNFVAGGLVTHNSIYGFRGADIRNILDFEDDYPGRARRQVRAELPLDADDPGRGQRGDRQQPRADAQAAVDGSRGGRPVRVREMADEHAEARCVTAEIERLVDEGVVARRDRGLLPDQRAVAGARGHAGARADRLPGHRRHEVLRAGGDQGRGRRT